MRESLEKATARTVLPGVCAAALLCVGGLVIVTDASAGRNVRWGIITSLVVGLVAGLGWLLHSAPWSRQRPARRAQHTSREEVGRDPTTHLQEQVLERTNEIVAARRELRACQAKLRDVRVLLARRRREEPGADFSDDEQALTDMERQLVRQVMRLDAASLAMNEAQRRVTSAREDDPTSIMPRRHVLLGPEEHGA